MTTLINLTPHSVCLVIDDSRVIEIPSSGIFARCLVMRQTIGAITIDGATVPLVRAEFGPVEGLPDPRPDTYYIVSRVVAEAARHRTDLLIPDDTIRDATGHIVGCRALAFL